MDHAVQLIQYAIDTIYSILRHFNEARNSSGAGFWGDYRFCDIPKWTVENMFQSITTQHQVLIGLKVAICKRIPQCMLRQKIQVKSLENAKNLTYTGLLSLNPRCRLASFSAHVILH